jgi:propionyl-CoA carboxylase alpha chain
VEEGGKISAFYDPMISKVISFGMDRDDAIHRLVGALSHYELFGVKNNIDLCLWILNHPKYRANEVNTNFIETHFSLEEFNVASPDLFQAAAVAAALAEEARTPAHPATPPGPSQWRSKRFLNMR